VPETPDNKELRAQLPGIGIGPGKTSIFKGLSLAHKAAVLLAMKAGDDEGNKYQASGIEDMWRRFVRRNLGRDVTGAASRRRLGHYLHAVEIH